MNERYADLARSFEACDIDVGAFSHADHVAVAYQILRSHDFLDAVVKYARCIVMIATNAGAAQKFNTTITLAFLSLIAERMEATEHLSYDEFISKNSDLLADGILDKWYSPDRLKSELARRVFLMPDALVIEVQT